MNGWIIGQRAGALVISLDFELRWGVRDRYPLDGGAYRANLLGARIAIPRLLDLFAEFGIDATWATTGLLFAESRAEQERYRPAARPAWSDARLDPYRELVGAGAAEDPLHFASELIEQIAAAPGQEIGSHTFGHYYPLEAGHDAASFRADLESAVAIAGSRGIEMRSLVVPRNQFNPEYAGIISDLGFRVCRTNARGWIYRAADAAGYFRPDVRAGRLLDSYLPLSGNQVIRWDEIAFAGDLCLLPASTFLRPFTPRLRHLEQARFRRIEAGIRVAAESGGLYHLWWHPHNMGVHTEQFLAFLRGLLEVYAVCREQHGMRSLGMAGAAELARRTVLTVAA